MGPTRSRCALETVLAAVTSEWSLLLVAVQNSRGHQVRFHCSVEGVMPLNGRHSLQLAIASNNVIFVYQSKYLTSSGSVLLMPN